MHPISLKISSFCQYADEQIVDFGKYIDSIIAVTGTNKDDAGSNSNGSGKSNLFDAITWCLFDCVPRKLEDVNKIIRCGEKSCTVVFKFEHNGKVYEVNNYRDKNKSEYSFTVDGVKVEYRKKSDTIKELCNHIGMDYDLYLNIVYLSQNGEKALLSSDPKDRISLISKLLNINYDKQLKCVKEDIKKCEGDVSDCEGLLKGIDVLEDQRTVEQLNGEIDALNKELEIKNSAIVDIESKLKLYDNDKLELEKRENKKRELNDLIEQSREIDSSIVKLKNEKTELEESLKKERKNEFELMILNREKDRKDLEREQGELEQKKETQFKELNETLRRKDSVQTERDTLVRLSLSGINEINAIDIEISVVSQKIGELNGRAKNGTDKIKELEDALKIGGKCPTCQSVITEAHKVELNGLLEKYNKALIALKLDYEQNKEVERNLGNKKKEIQAAKDKIDKGLIKLEQELAKINAVDTELFKIEWKEREDEKKSQITQIEVVIADLKTKSLEWAGNVEKDLKTIKDKLLSVQNDITSLSDKVGKIRLNADKMCTEINEFKIDETLPNKIAEMTQLLGNEKESVVNVQNEVAVLVSIIKSKGDNEKKRIEILERKKNLFKDKEKYLFWEKAFGDYGIKKLAINQFIPEFETCSNKYLQLMEIPIRLRFTMEAETKDGDYKDKFDIVIFDGDKKLSWDSWSGGQKKRVAVAISQALRTLVTSRLGISIDFSIYDEVIDAIDQQGIFFISKLFRSVGGNHFVISHNHSSEFVNMFEHNIHLEYKDKKTTVVKNE